VRDKHSEKQTGRQTGIEKRERTSREKDIDREPEHINIENEGAMDAEKQNREGHRDKYIQTGREKEREGFTKYFLLLCATYADVTGVFA